MQTLKFGRSLTIKSREMGAFLRFPKPQMASALFLIFITALLHTHSFFPLRLLVLSIGGAVFFDLLFLKARKIPWFFPGAGIVSGLIVTLLIPPDVVWYKVLIFSFLAIFSKNFIRAGRHIFNPAGFGLLLGSILARVGVSWWGTSFQGFTIYDLRFMIYFLILLFPFLVSAVRMRRYQIQVPFLIFYALSNKILNSKFSILSSILDPTILFFTAVMLPEPMTTPNRPFRQIAFGVFVAISSIIFSSSIFNFKFSILNSYDPLILSLLLGNLAFFKFR